jgi:hypothetical protein
MSPRRRVPRAIAASELARRSGAGRALDPGCRMAWLPCMTVGGPSFRLCRFAGGRARRPGTSWRPTTRLRQHRSRSLGLLASSSQLMTAVAVGLSGGEVDHGRRRRAAARSRKSWRSGRCDVRGLDGGGGRRSVGAPLDARIGPAGISRPRANLLAKRWPVRSRNASSASASLSNGRRPSFAHVPRAISPARWPIPQPAWSAAMPVTSPPSSARGARPQRGGGTSGDPAATAVPVDVRTGTAPCPGRGRSAHPRGAAAPSARSGGA